MMPVAWHERAVDDLSHAIGFYSSRSATLAGRFLDEIDAAVGHIRSRADLGGGERDFGFARQNLRRFPYFVGYVVLSGRIWILAVSFSKRGDLRSWHDRARALSR